MTKIFNVHDFEGEFFQVNLSPEDRQTIWGKVGDVMDRNDPGSFKFEGWESDPMFEDTGERFLVRPVPKKYKPIYDLYKFAFEKHWTAEEIDLHQDPEDWKKLTKNEQKYIIHVLTFFASADAIVAVNVNSNLIDHFTPNPINQYYRWQCFNEDIHSETYALLIETLCPDEEERKAAFTALLSQPAVIAKGSLLDKWLSEDVSVHERLIAFTASECIFFGNNFASFVWLRQEKRLLPGVTFSNDKIMDDEGVHVKGGFEIYKLFEKKLPQWRVYQIICEFVEREFAALDIIMNFENEKGEKITYLDGLHLDDLKKNTLWCADYTLAGFGYEPIWNLPEHPLPFMVRNQIDSMTSVHEKQNPNYFQSVIVSNVSEIDLNETDF